MKAGEATRRTDAVTMNLAWNEIVQGLIDKGVYSRFIASDQARITVQFYGTVPGISWNGGRFNRRIGTLSVPQLLDSIRRLNERNIGFNFTFNSTLLTDSQLDDDVPNAVLQACRSPLNGVICASYLLSQYIQESYPEYRRTLSCILSYHHVHELDGLFDPFDMIVLPEDLNPDFDYLKHLRCLQKIEVILNSSCVYKCPYRVRHYQLVHADMQREARGEAVRERDDPCVKLFKTKKDWVVDNDRLTVDKQFVFPELLPAYLTLGVRHFKFLDRQQPPELGLLLDYWIMLEECLGSGGHHPVSP